MNKSGFTALDYTVIILYFLALVVMGLYLSRRRKGTNDFFLAGQRIPWWAAGLSIFGTQLSAITYMAIPAKAYATDWKFFLMNMGIVVVAPFIVLYFLPFYRRLNITTAYEYLEKRFNVKVRLVASLSYILLQLGRMGVVLFLPALALSTVSGFNISLSIIAMGISCTLYTVMGGMEAVIWTDVVQVFILLGGAILSIIVIVLKVHSGIGEMFTVALNSGKFHMLDYNIDFSSPVIWVIIISWLGQLVPYTADQTVIQRYLTTKSERDAARSIWTNAVLCIPTSLLFFGIGTALYVFYKSNPEHLNPTLSTDSIFPWFIVHELPTGIAGIVIAGIFAAAMSTLSAILNSLSTTVITDFYRRFRPQTDDRVCLKIALWLTVVFGFIGTTTALFMAQSDFASLWDLFIQILGLIGGGIAGLFILGIFTRQANGTGAFIGIITSAFVQYLVQSRTSLHFLLYPATGIVSCVVVGYFTSFFTKPAATIPEGLTIYTLKKEV